MPALSWEPCAAPEGALRELPSLLGAGTGVLPVPSILWFFFLLCFMVIHVFVQPTFLSSCESDCARHRD